MTVGGSVGSATWGTMPVSVGKFQYVVNIPGWWAFLGVQEGQGERLFDLGYCLWVYGGKVVPEGVLDGVPVRTGGASCRLHGLHCKGVVEGDVVEAVNFRGPLCPPVRQRGVVAVGAVQGIVDSCPLHVGVNGNVGVLCGVYPDSLCGSRLGRLVVVSQGCPYQGGRVPGGYEKVHGLCFFFRHGGLPPKALHQSGLTMGKMSVHGEPKFPEGQPRVFTNLVRVKTLHELHHGPEKVKILVEAISVKDANGYIAYTKAK